MSVESREFYEKLITTVGVVQGEGCPSVNTLISTRMGEVDGKKEREIALHLCDCEACRTMFQAINT